MLLASDRNATIERAPAAFGRDGCAVVSLARGAGRRPRGQNSEHGPWAGAAAAHDVELLARATHAFVGTHVSSLSFLMYARAAFRAAAEPAPAQSAASAPRLRYHTLPGCVEQPALPPPPPWPCTGRCRGVL